MKATRFISMAMALVLLLCLLTGCGGGETSSEQISATIILVLEDGTEISHDITVAGGQTIRQALYEAGLIDDENNTSMFVNTIDGYTADAMNDGVTWLPCDEDGNQLTGGATDVVCTLDAYTVEDGETIKLVYYVVPNYDD